jgi:phosphoenolpyruvate---glycerone phosphotransferase subunit DhaL
VRAWLLDAAARIGAAAEELTALDARIGDGDHGINLGRGMSLVASALSDPDARAGMVLTTAGRTLVSSVGGASGPLYGTLFLEMGAALREDEATPIRFADAFEHGVEAVGRRGRSTVGQKTMLDTLVPAAATLRIRVRAGDEWPVAVRAAASEAAVGCDSTRPMIAQRGRASYLGERAIGHLDPGAVSSRLLVDSLVATASRARGQRRAATSSGTSR